MGFLTSMSHKKLEMITQRYAACVQSGPSRVDTAIDRVIIVI